MYGFGDSENPNPETVELLESFVIEYIQNITITAFKRSKRRGFKEIKLKDLLQVIKHDKKKYYRVASLLSFSENLKKNVGANNLSKKAYKKHIKDLAKEGNQ